MGYEKIKFPPNSTFLVTGGAGFIGTNLCETILNLGYNVRCLDNFSTGKQKNVDLFADKDNYKFIYGDIKDTNKMRIMIQQFSTIVFPSTCSIYTFPNPLSLYASTK